MTECKKGKQEENELAEERKQHLEADQIWHQLQRANELNEQRQRCLEADTNRLQLGTEAKKSFSSINK